MMHVGFAIGLIDGGKLNTEEFIRRRPVYLLLDTSSSMFGAPITAVQQGVQLIHRELMNNPHAIETVYLSVITFDSSAKQIVQLVSVEAFTPPTLKAEGNTALGAALRHFSTCASRGRSSSGLRRAVRQTALAIDED